MCTCVYMNVYIVKVELQILLSFSFSRIPMILNAGENAKWCSCLGYNPAVYKYLRFTGSQILNCKAGIDLTVWRNRELTSLYVM